MDPKLFAAWKQYIPNLEQVLEKMAAKPLVSVGIPPYPRVIPSLFLPKDKYYLYCTKLSADVAVLKNYANVIAIGETDPELAEKVQSTLYLLKNYSFHNFLKSLPKPYFLLFFQTSQPIVDYLEEQHIPWLGHNPKSFEPLVHKEGFRSVLKELNVHVIPDWIVTIPQFLNKQFEDIHSKWKCQFVCQPADYEISGSTYFINSQEDMENVQQIFSTNPKFQKVNTLRLSPFVKGEAVSMLGCVTKKGVLTGPLQLQLIDVPESLRGNQPSGAFFGHDWGFCNWPDSVELTAQDITEKIGLWLQKRGYKGIFGVDYMYDDQRQTVFPLECNPRSTGAIPAFSEVNIKNGVPPIDFFTLAEFFDIPIEFDFATVNKAWKTRTPAAHISIVPTNILKMNLSLPAGAYRLDASSGSLQYVKPAAFLHELSPDEFIIIDQVPMHGQNIVQNVPRLLKFIFPISIAEATNKIKPEVGHIISSISSALEKA